MAHTNTNFLTPVVTLLRSGLLALSLLVAGVMFALPVSAAEAGSPTAAVQSVVDSILAVLRKPGFDMTTDRPAISAEIKRAFDDTAMAQSVLSTNWRTATPEQQTEFKALLLQTIEGTYLGRIKAYTNETVAFGKEEIRENRATVNTTINAATGPIPVNYKLRQRSDGWFVYDVEVENVSMVNSYRDTYRDVVARDGMDSLLEQMRSKLAEIEI